MTRLVGLCGNDNSGRLTLAYGLAAAGWYLCNIETDIAAGMDPLVAVQKALADTQDNTGNVVLAGLSNLDQVQLIRLRGGVSVFIERPELAGNPFDVQVARGQCNMVFYNTDPIAESQEKLLEDIEAYFTNLA